MLQCYRSFIIFLFLLSLMSVQAVQAQTDGASPQLVFDQANSRFQEGNYREALADYRLLENRNSISGALFLNMGISYIQVDSLGKAKCYFLKASRFEETESKAQQGLKYVESRFSRQSAVLPKLPWEKAVNWLRIHIGATALLGAGLFLLNVGVIGFVVAWFYKKFGGPLRISGLSLAGAGMLLLLLSFYVQYVDQRYSNAVMVHAQSNVLEQPSPESPVINQAYEGYTFTVDHYQSVSHPGWSYVRMSNGLYGWIKTSDLCTL